MSLSTPNPIVTRRPGLKPWWPMVALALVLGARSGSGWAADETPPLEYKVKAAFLVKFASFIEWPAKRSGTNGSFTIGILGEDPFGKDFDDAVQQERVNYQPVVVRRAGNVSELKDCKIIFVSRSESHRLAELFQTLDGKPILVVGEENNFAQQGGMIGFIKEGGKVRFEINLAAAERADLRLSAKLLQVGKIIVPGRSRAGD